MLQNPATNPGKYNYICLMYRLGNIILYDHDQYRKPTNPCIRGMVGRQGPGFVEMKGGFKAKIETCAGLPITDSWFPFYGINANDYPEFKFVHELQNYHFEKFGCDLEMVADPSSFF